MKTGQEQARETTFVRFSEQGLELWWVLAIQSGVFFSGVPPILIGDIKVGDNS
jgi:hypothetical protein